MDRLLAAKSVNSVRRLLTETVKQAGVEASEETFTEIANILSNAAIMGDNSDFNQTVQGYMAQGMSEDEAKKRAYLDMVGQVAWAGAGGLISGGVMGGGVNMMNYGTRSINQNGLIDDQARAAFGEQGQKVMDVVMENAAHQGMNQADAYGAFAQAYYQGSTGKEMTAIPGLTQDAQELAYHAGREDAGVTTAPAVEADPNTGTAPLLGITEGETEAKPSKVGLLRRGGVTERTTRGVNTPGERAVRDDVAGLVRDEYVNANLDTETANTVDAVAKALGVRVQFTDVLSNAGATGEIQGNVVQIRKNTEDPLKRVFGHEITHRMQELDPRSYNAFRDIAGAERGDYVQGYQEWYWKHGVELSYEEALDEVTAEFAGELIRDGEVLEQFIQNHQADRNLLQRVLDAIRELVRKLPGMQKQQAQTAEARLTAALEASSRQVEKETRKNKNAAQKSGGARYSIANTRNMPWDKQVRGYFTGDKTIKSSDSLYLGESDVVGVQHSPLYVPTSVITKAIRPPKGSRSAHALTETDILKLEDGINNAPVVIRNPTRNALVYMTGNQDSAGNYIIAAFDLNNDLHGENAHKATSIHGRENLVALLEKLGADATIFVKNENKLNQMLPGDQILKSLKLLAKVELDNGSIAENGLPVNTKYSMAGTEEIVSNAQLRKQVESLQERVDYWKGQTRRTEKVTTDKKAVQKAARKLVKDLGADLDAREVADELQELYDYMAQNGGEEGIRYEEVCSRAEAIAAELVDNAVVAEDSLYQQYRDLRQYLKDTKIVVPEEVTRDIPDFESYRRANSGRMNLSAKGTPNIDRVFSELFNMYPEFFNEDETTPASDQLMRIVDVAGELYNIQELNPFAGQESEAVQGMANEIMEIFFDLPQTRATFADRQAAKYDKLRAENQARLDARITKERERREKEVNALRDKYAAKTAASRESRNAGELRRKITRHTKQLSQKLLRPTDKQHIPENLRGAVAAVLQSINQESTYSVDPETGKRVEPDAGVNTKKTEAWRKLKEEYIAAAKDDSTAMVLILTCSETRLQVCRACLMKSSAWATLPLVA